MKRSERYQGQSNHVHLDIELLSAYIDGEVTFEERVQVERHLQRCQTCTEELESLRWTVNLLHEVPPVAVPRPFAIRHADLEPEVTRRQSPWPDWLVNGLQWATVVTAILVVLTFAVDLLNVGRPASAPAVLLSKSEKAVLPAVEESLQPAGPQTEASPRPERERVKINEPAGGSLETPPMPAGTAAPQLAAPPAPVESLAGQPEAAEAEEAVPGVRTLREAEATPPPVETPAQAFNAPEATPAVPRPAQAPLPGRTPNRLRLAEVGLAGLFVVLLGLTLWARRRRTA